MISKRTISAVKNLTDAIALAMEKNENNLLVDAFEASDIGKEVYNYAYVYTNEINLSITVKTGAIAEEVTEYWKAAVSGLRVNSFKDMDIDTSNPYRKYIMNNRDRDQELTVEISTHFASGTCEFVEIKTGEIEEVPARPAEEAYSKEVVTRILKCDEVEVPTGLPAPSLQLAD